MSPNSFDIEFTAMVLRIHFWRIFLAKLCKPIHDENGEEKHEYSADKYVRGRRYKLFIEKMVYLILEFEEIAKLHQNWNSLCMQQLKVKTFLSMTFDNFGIHFCNWQLL